MNGIKPTAGFEFEDKYIEARKKLIDFVKALDELDSAQKKRLADEFITSITLAASFEQFATLMRNGGNPNAD